jgi:hypothetical protein
MGEAPVRECAICQGSVRRIVSPVGIVFKGSGFYVTDNRNGKSNGATATPSNGKAKSESGGETSDTKSSGATPAASPSAPAATTAD